ncbi:MAG TPA: POTRA domain-containing protein, partial [Kofleriaceae bacterium]|nr:POTRA domain-containing protein [Kofleriaceae bacterium]
MQPPPETWSEWEVTGELIDPPDVVRAFLAQRMESASSALTEGWQSDIGDFCKTLGYELVEVKTRRNDKSQLVAVLVLRPQTTVFWIYVDIDNVQWTSRNAPQQFFEQIFDEQITRRMQIRQGDALPVNERPAKLAAEKRRIEEFLHNEGFFDARARLYTREHDRYSLDLHVDIDKGQRYTVGVINVVGNASVGAPEIGALFRHAAVCLIVCVGTARFRK